MISTVTFHSNWQVGACFWKFCNSKLAIAFRKFCTIIQWNRSEIGIIFYLSKELRIFMQSFGLEEDQYLWQTMGSPRVPLLPTSLSRTSTHFLMAFPKYRVCLCQWWRLLLLWSGSRSLSQYNSLKYCLGSVLCDSCTYLMLCCCDIPSIGMISPSKQVQFLSNWFTLSISKVCWCVYNQVSGHFFSCKVLK